MRPTFRHAAKSTVVGRFALLPLGSFLFAVFFSWPVPAADRGTNDQKAVLSIILDTAKSICSDTPSDGRYRDIRIKGSPVQSPTDSSASPSGEFITQELRGLSSNDVLNANENTINCKLTVISKLVEKLLPSTGLTDSTTSKSLEVTDDPGPIAGEIIKEVCRLQIGMSERNVKGECEHGSCNIEHETIISYTPFTVYLKPGLESFFYSPFKFEENRESEIKTKWPSDVLSTKSPIPVKSRFKFTAFPTGYIAHLSKCVDVIGNLLLQRLKPYEVERILTSQKFRATEYNKVQHTLRELDFDVLQLWYPRYLRSGSNSTIEATIIPSAVLKTQSINIDENRSDEEAQKKFSEVEREIATSTAIGDALKNDQRDKLSIKFSFGEYQLLSLVKQDNYFSEASLKLVLDSITVTPLTSEQQTLRPLQPRSWSWLLKPNKSGQHTLYVSVQAKRTTGEQVSSVFPVQIVVEESYFNRVINFLSVNWQWIAGSIIIPLIVFVWSRVMRAREQSDEGSRGRHDRRNLRRR